MKMKISIVAGDGIGPEITSEALKVLDAVCAKYNHEIETEKVLAGGCAIDAKGKPLPEETVETCKASDAVLLGAVGGPKWDTLPGNMRPERALLGLRSALGLYCNLRPAVLHEQLRGASPLKSEIINGSLDVMVVRELTGGIYFGEHSRSEDGQSARDIMEYSVMEIERIARKAFEVARKRNRRVTSVDKQNVLATSRLWRETVSRVAQEYPDVELNHLYVDNTAMQLVRNPKQFDVILTENMFGDILSDEASMIAGSLGMLPSASLGDGAFGMYEPIHGSAPDIAGKDLANPLATILSVSMMLRYTFSLAKEADAIDRAVDKVLSAGLRTADIFTGDPGQIKVGTRAMGTAVAEAVD